MENANNKKKVDICKLKRSKCRERGLFFCPSEGKSIIDDKEQENLISKIYRVLKKDGIIYINDFLLNGDKRNLNIFNEFKEKF